MENLNIPKLDSRLEMAASMVSGDFAADIGTDHAYIPINLLLKNKCRKAIAADINEGPLENAKKNAAQCGVYDKIDFYLTDGLSGIPLDGVTDIIICGMGGELEARIISECDRAHDSSISFILQPMSAVQKLRAFLYGEGYRITDGAVAVSGGKIYQCIACRYDGTARPLSPAEALVGGADEPLRRHPLYPRLLEKHIKKAEKELIGRRAGGLNTDDAEKLLAELMNIYDNCK